MVIIITSCFIYKAFTRAKSQTATREEVQIWKALCLCEGEGDFPRVLNGHVAPIRLQKVDVGTQQKMSYDTCAI